jgi:hypothetical protein
MSFRHEDLAGAEREIWIAGMSKIDPYDPPDPSTFTWQASHASP